MSKIVVVDDSYAELQMIEGYLKAANHTVVSFPNTDKLEDKVAAEKPDLIVMDVVMPNKNGIDACRELKAHPQTHAIPIILATTRGEQENVEAGWAAGCNDYVTKPVNGAELLAKVRDLIRE